MQTELLQEARRQAEICNACRYCEGYCSVFPALHRERAFSDANLTHLANLCHNCRGCYYACQYTAPHEFDLNLPKALAEVRQASWEDYAWPQPVARLFQKSGLALAFATILGPALLFAAILALPSEGNGFYSALSHGAMVAIFGPAFVLPLIAMAQSIRRFSADIGGDKIGIRGLLRALSSASHMKNLSGGHGDGCNFEDEDRFSQSRRLAHQAVMFGFLLCFLSTSTATLLHYVFAQPAPYPFWSLPKIFGVPGGVLMVVGSIWLAALKLRADPALGAASAWGGEMAFIFLLFFVSASGLVLYALGSTDMMPVLLALHLGAVLSFFVLSPYTKMAHGFYRLAALATEAEKRGSL